MSNVCISYNSKYNSLYSEKVTGTGFLPVIFSHRQVSITIERIWDLGHRSKYTVQTAIQKKLWQIQTICKNFHPVTGRKRPEEETEV
jgi:hypothetical protein